MSRRNRYPFARPDAAQPQPAAVSSGPAPSAPGAAPAAVEAPVVDDAAALRAEVEALKAQLAAKAAATPPPGPGRSVLRVGWTAVHYGGRDHAPGAAFPFYLDAPPDDVSPGFLAGLREGVHYVWAAE